MSRPGIEDPGVVPSEPGGTPARRRTRLAVDTSAGRAVIAVEVLLAVVAIVLDQWILTIDLLVLAAASLLLHRQRPSAFGLVEPVGSRWWPLQIMGLAAVWTLLTIGLTIPVLEHLTGERQDVSQFAVVEGNLAALAALLALSWTFAALGEEVAYRGFLLTRLRELIGGTHPSTAITLLACGAVAVLFGWVHREQGIIGMATTCIDALFFTWLRFHYRSLWASVLAHGFNNTIGLVAYFLVGPIYGLW